jgi:uptake hydrogenase large subunit
LNPAGQLHIQLNWQGGSVQGVALSSSRPFPALRVFNGKTPEQLLTMVPLLFNVCGIAQGHAAIGASRQALAMEPDFAGQRARQMLVLLETAREHGWRIMNDWPSFADLPAEKPQWARLSSLIVEFKSALFENGDAFSLNAAVKIDHDRLERGIAELEALLDEQIFAGRLREWRNIGDLASFGDWLRDTPGIAAQLLKRLIAKGMASAGQCPSAWLPALDEAELHQILSGPRAQTFIEAPVWNGQVLETGALNRQRHQPLINGLLHEYGNGLVTRLAACLSELADIPPRLRQCTNELNDSSSVASNFTAFTVDDSGLTQVEAARGLLIHRLVLEQGRVASYQIVAPTEWNFHPAGVAALALRELAADDEPHLRRQAAMLISAIDPCVGYRLTIAPDSVKMQPRVTGGNDHA